MRSECDSADFKKEAYRLPTFEVLLNNAQKCRSMRRSRWGCWRAITPAASSTDRPIKWRVTPVPLHLDAHPAATASCSPAMRGSPASRRSAPRRCCRATAKTDAGGSAQLTLDPTLEPTAQPRTYMVEATVTGDDGQQIRNVAHVPALPPFVLGVKMPRYLPQPGAIAADLLALDAEGKPRAGLDMTVRLIKRDWNSVLQASDFTQGTAKYVTQEIDRTLEERHVTSTERGADAEFRHAEAGRLCRGGDRARTGSAGGRRLQRRLLHGRRHAGDLVAAAGEDGRR